MTSAQLRRAPLGSRAFTILEREGLLDDDERLGGMTVRQLADLRACGNTTVLEVDSLRSLPVAELANQATVRRFDPEQQAANLLARYHDRHRLVLRHRLLPASPMTLQELGRELDVTGERIRQLERGVREDLATHFSGALRRLAARTGEAFKEDPKDDRVVVTMDRQVAAYRKWRPSRPAACNALTRPTAPR